MPPITGLISALIVHPSADDAFDLTTDPRGEVAGNGIELAGKRVEMLQLLDTNYRVVSERECRVTI